MNENKGVYFLNLKIDKFRCFGENAILNLSDEKGNWKQWTVLLGNNGTGKTSILQLLARVETTEINLPGEPEGTQVAKGFVQYFPETLGNLDASVLIDNEIDRVSFGSYGATMWSHSIDIVCYGYGANRFMSLNALAESKSENSETLFNDDSKLINAEEWLLQLDYAASKESDVKAYAIQRRDDVKRILQELLPEITEIRFSTPTKENLKSSVEFHTPFGWVTIHQLSLGYKTMVAWMVDLAARLFERYPDSDNPLAEPAIVLIDEIDLHLHPKWQRSIFDYLSKLFPATQFIISAHSPLVVQSAPKEANIALLRREGDHVVIDQNIKSVNQWRLDQILTSDLFGIESPRSPQIEKQMLRRIELIQKSNLLPEERLELEQLNNIAHNLPAADNELDNEAMKIIREAAEILQKKK